VVLTPARNAPVPALVLPDEQTWTVLGADPAAHGIQPSFDPTTVRRLLAPARVPAELAAALAEYSAALDADITVQYAGLSLGGEAAVRALGEPNEHREHDQAGQGAGHHEHAHHEHAHGEHDHAGHHDMMAIVGEPSTDGLVMEPIRLSYGPFGTSLPGGLVAEVTLDGDVVAESELRGLPRVERSGIPDLLSPVAWAVAMGEDGAAAATNPWLRIAAVEVERAVSHVAWLRSLGRLVDLQPLVDRCTRTLEALQVSRRVEPDDGVTDAWLRAAVGQPDFDESRERLLALAAWVGRSSALRWRLGGRAVVAPARAREQSLRGPVARASGVEDDTRAGDVRYRELGFSPVLHEQGDALARARVRAEEALAAVGLAVDALELEYVGADAPTRAPVVVEGPRGPITARSSSPGSWKLAAPAGDATRHAAAQSMIGSEWATALVGLASFDLSPWSVGS
jgi:hypothetical protein